MEIDKIGNVLQQLRLEISKIGDSNEYKISYDAFEGHLQRYRSDLELILKLFNKGKILEVGSSPYHISFCLKKMGFDTYGIDINPKILKTFQIKNKLRIQKCDIEVDKLPFKDKEFELVVFSEVFEHLRLDPIHAIREIERVLKPKGILILTTPNLYALHKIIMFNLGMSFNNALTQFQKIDEVGYLGHIREYSKKEVVEIVSYSGLKFIKSFYKKYNNFSEISFLKKFPVNVMARIADLLTDFFPSFRQFQIFIFRK